MLPFQTDYNCINTSKITLTSGKGTLIKANDYTPVTNCSRYAPSAQTYSAVTCYQCASGYFLKKPASGANTCVATSKLDTETKYLLVISEAASMYTRNVVDLSVTNTNNVRLAALNSGLKTGSTAVVSTAIIGASCRSSFFVVVDLYNWESTNINPATASTSSVFIDDWSRITPMTKCITQNFANGMTKHQTGTATTTAFCDLYADQKTLYDTLTANVYECVKCPQGKVGQVVAGATGNNNQKRKEYGAGASYQSIYINACSTFTNCNTTKKFLYNIPVYWSKLFSCYFCSNGGIPVLLMEGSTKDLPLFKNWKRVNLTDSTNWTTNIPTNVMNQTCMDVSKVSSISTALGLSGLAVQLIKPLIGCGLAVLNLAYTRAQFNNQYWAGSATTLTANSSSLVCVACAPNHAPTFFTGAVTAKNAKNSNNNLDFNNNKDHFVVNCQPIANCTSSTNVLANGCQKCDTGFGFFASGTYGTTNTYEIVRTKCVKLPENNLNCLAYLTFAAANPTSGTTASAYAALPKFGHCAQCNIGYYLNSNGFCDKIGLPGCATGQFTDLRLVNNKKSNVPYILYMKQFGVQNCYECGTGYALVSNKKVNAGVTAIDTANSINFHWQCATSTFVGFLTKLTNWDTKTNRSTYLNEYVFMCNVYTFLNIAKSSNYYQFKYDQYNTFSGNVTTSNTNNYKASSSNRTTTAVSNNAGDNRYQCVKCTTGYVLSQFNDYCYPTDLLQNCAIAFDYNDCKECKATFTRVVVIDQNVSTKFVAQCVNMTVPNCATVDHKNTLNKISPQCTTCNAGYYWNSTNDRCELGNVANCKVHSSLNVCTTCNTNYALYSSGGVSHCFPYYSKNMNCTAMSVTTVNGNTVTQLGFQCTASTCTNGTFGLNVTTTLATAYYACSKFSITPNCATYDTLSSTALITAPPKCSSCNAGYYLDSTNKVCVARVVSLSNCATSNATKDECTTGGCSSGYYLTTLKNCIANPVGTYKCAVYDSTGKVCQSCQDGFYLDTKTTTCMKITNTITNCVTYETATTCKACKFDTSGYYQVTSNGSSCTQIVIQNCLLPNSTGTNCLQCKAGFIPSSGGNTCVAVTTLIVGCKVQSTNTSCQACYNNWVLSLDGSACYYIRNNSYNKCINETTTQQPVCFLCQKGYNIVKGVCTKDVALANLTNCAFANPLNAKLCEVCQVGSFMKTAGTCDTNPVQISVAQMNQAYTASYEAVSSSAA